MWNWRINRAAGTHVTVSPASLLFPVLAVSGVLLGALLASTTSKEFRWSSPDNSLKTFIYGALGMNSALLAGGCWIRLLVRSAGDEMRRVLGVPAIVAGETVRTFYVRRRGHPAQPD